MLEYQYQNRTMVAQALNLTPAQKRELQEFLEWNAQPENREYRYDYYRDNCSTRVRDVLDRVLGGRLRAATEGVPTGTTFRWHTDRLIADDKSAYVGLLVARRRRRPADRRVAGDVPAGGRARPGGAAQRAGTDGRMVPLVASEHVLVEAVNRAPERTQPPFWLPYFLAAGIALGAVLAGLGRGDGGRGARASPLACSVRSGRW